VQRSRTTTPGPPRNPFPVFPSLKYIILSPLGSLFHLEYAGITLFRNIYTYTYLLTSCHHSSHSYDMNERINLKVININAA
jgi:hypothetical protein